MYTTIDTHHVPSQQSLTTWKDAVSTHLVSVECKGKSGNSLTGDFTQVSNDNFAIARLHAGAHIANRDRAVLKNSDTSFYLLFIQRSGTMYVNRGNQRFSLAPGEMYFYDGASEHELTFREEFEHLAVRVPKAESVQRWPLLCQAGSFWLPKVNSMHHEVMFKMGSAALVSEYEEGLNDVVAAMFTLMESVYRHTAPLSHLSDAKGNKKLFNQINSYINIHLTSPELSASTIAEYLHISRRQFDRCLADAGTTFSKYLVEKRLFLASQLLKQSTSRKKSVTEIALETGFAK